MLSEEVDRPNRTPAKDGSGVVTRAERMQAAGEWLISAAPVIAQGLAEWRDNGSAWIRPGVLFSAVSIPADVVHAAIRRQSPQDSAALLAELLAGGPMFYHPEGFGPEAGYTALLPASAGRQWGLPGAVALAQRALLLVPAPDRCAPRLKGPWWVVPLDGPGLLCDPDFVAGIVSLGRQRLGLPIGRGQ